MSDKWIIFFGEDWGRHHSTGQFLAKELAGEYQILWVNSLGMRTPKLNFHDLSRIISKLTDFVAGMFSKRNDEAALKQESVSNVDVLAPLAIPFLHSRLVRAFNKAFVLRLIKKEMARLGVSQPVVITACPASVDLLDDLGAKLKVYYCADEYSEMPGMDKALVCGLESELLAKVDVVAATAKKLVETKSKLHNNVHYLPHGVDYQLFQQAVTSEYALPEDIAGLQPPIIGFVGLIGEHIDMTIIQHLAEAFKELPIVMVGPVEDGIKLVDAPNIIYTGGKSRDELPAYLAHFTVCIIPYKQMARVEYANPTKLNEYLAAGRPVVTVPHPEIDESAPGIHVADSHTLFVQHIKDILKDKAVDHEGISKTMEKSTWWHRAQVLHSIIESTPPKG